MKKADKKKKNVTKKTSKKKKPLKIKKARIKAISAKKIVKRKIILKKKQVHKISERVATGIANFDGLIEEGFEKNSTNLLVGGAGSGKSIFATQFLFGGMKKGEKCLYVTFEEKKKQFYRNMARFGMDLEHYEKRGLFIFLEYTPAKVKTMLEEGGGTIESIILTKKISRIVIDSITSFVLLFDDQLEKREAALSLFNMIRKWDCTSLLTLEGKPFTDQQIDSRTLEFESDSIIFFYFLREKKQRERYLEILKMRGTKHSKKLYRFQVDKTGINIEKSPSPTPQKLR